MSKPSSAGLEVAVGGLAGREPEAFEQRAHERRLLAAPLLVETQCTTAPELRDGTFATLPHGAEGRPTTLDCWTFCARTTYQVAASWCCLSSTRHQVASASLLYPSLRSQPQIFPW